MSAANPPDPAANAAEPEQWHVRLYVAGQSPTSLKAYATAPETEPYTLTLFVSGASDSSAQAIANVRDICDGYLKGRYNLEIVDLHQEPALAREHNVLATPTLIKDHPLPTRMLVGNMSDHPRVLIALDVSLAATPTVEPDDADTSSGP